MIWLQYVFGIFPVDIQYLGVKWSLSFIEPHALQSSQYSWYSADCAVITWSIFSQTITKDSSTVRVRCGVSFVDPASDWYSALVYVIIVIYCTIGPCYKGAQLYYLLADFFIHPHCQKLLSLSLDLFVKISLFQVAFLIFFSIAILSYFLLVCLLLQYVALFPSKN